MEDNISQQHHHHHHHAPPEKQNKNSNKNKHNGLYKIDCILDYNRLIMLATLRTLPTSNLTSSLSFAQNSSFHHDAIAFSFSLSFSSLLPFLQIIIKSSLLSIIGLLIPFFLKISHDLIFHVSMFLQFHQLT